MPKDSSRKLKVLHWNINGLASASNNKLNREDGIIPFLEGYDIMFLSETWSSDTHDLTLPGYVCYHCHRQDKNIHERRPSGGNLVYIRDTLTDRCELLRHRHDDIVWLKYLTKSATGDEIIWLIAGVYMVPVGSSRKQHTPDRFEELANDMSEFIAEYEGQVVHFMVGGDFNARMGKSTDYLDEAPDIFLPLPPDYVPDSVIPRNFRDTGTNTQAKDMKELCVRTGLRLINGRVKGDEWGEYTCHKGGLLPSSTVSSLPDDETVHHDGADTQAYRGSSTVDYVLLCEEDFHYVLSFKVERWGEFSDHTPLTTVLDVNHVVPLIESGKSKQRKLFWTEDQAEEVKALIDAKIPVLNDIVNGSDDIHVKTANFENELFECVYPGIGREVRLGPRTKKVYDYPPGATPEYCTARDKMEQAWKNNGKGPTKAKWNFYKSCRNEFTRVRRKFKVDQRLAESERIKNASYSDIRQFWRLVKGNKDSPMVNVTLPQFTTYFKGVTCPDSDSYYRPSEQVVRTVESSEDIPCSYPELDAGITMEEYTKALRTCKNHKSAGPDGLIYEVIGASASLNPVVLRLFNEIFESGVFPRSWTTGILVPILKKGSPHQAENYRGISLLPVLSKLLTKILNNRMLLWADKFEVLDKGQAGFRPGYTAMDNLQILQAFMEKWLTTNSRLYMCFIDMRKAFDMVDRQTLWYKLINMGLTGKVLRLFKSMYEEVKSQVRGFCGDMGEAFAVLFGVRQGESASPLLYSFLINDLREHLLSTAPSCKAKWDTLAMLLLMYADDIVIISDTARGLQDGLDSLKQYCDKWGLKVNIAKSKVMMSRPAMRTRQEQFFYDGSALDNVNHFCYLGLEINYNGRWTVAIHTLAMKAKKTLFGVNRMLAKHILPISDRIRIFNTVVEPILLYGAELWGGSKAMDVNKVHKTFLKLTLGIKVNTPDYLLYLETGQLSLEAKRDIRLLSYWGRLLSQPASKLTKEVYELMRASNLQWCKDVQNTLEKYSLQDYWNRQSMSRPDEVFGNTVKRKVKDYWFKRFCEQLSSSKGSFYRHLVGKELKMPSYLSVLGLSYARWMARLRVRSHYLHVETGTWEQHPLPLVERLCDLCGVVEDEPHVLLSCPRYRVLRNLYLPEPLKTSPTVENLVSVLNGEEKRQLTCIAALFRKMAPVQKEVYSIQVQPRTLTRRQIRELRERPPDVDDIETPVVTEDQADYIDSLSSSISMPEGIWDTDTTGSFSGFHSSVG